MSDTKFINGQFRTTKDIDNVKDFIVLQMMQNSSKDHPTTIDELKVELNKDSKNSLSAWNFEEVEPFIDTLFGKGVFKFKNSEISLSDDPSSSVDNTVETTKKVVDPSNEFENSTDFISLNQDNKPQTPKNKNSKKPLSTKSQTSQSPSQTNQTSKQLKNKKKTDNASVSSESTNNKVGKRKIDKVDLTEDKNEMEVDAEVGDKKDGKKNKKTKTQNEKNEKNDKQETPKKKSKKNSKKSDDGNVSGSGVNSNNGSGSGGGSGGGSGSVSGSDSGGVVSGAGGGVGGKGVSGNNNISVSVGNEIGVFHQFSKDLNSKKFNLDSFVVILSDEGVFEKFCDILTPQIASKCTIYAFATKKLSAPINDTMLEIFSTLIKEKRFHNITTKYNNISSLMFRLGTLHKSFDNKIPFFFFVGNNSVRSQGDIIDCFEGSRPVSIVTDQEKDFVSLINRS